MAHLVNPTSFRLSYVKYWNNIWCTSNNFNYAYLNHQDYNIYKYILFYFSNKTPMLAGTILDNVKSIRSNTTLNIFIYIKDQQFCSFLFEECEWLFYYGSGNNKALLKPYKHFFFSGSGKNKKIKTLTVKKIYRFNCLKTWVKSTSFYFYFRGIFKNMAISIIKNIRFLYLYKHLFNCIFFSTIGYTHKKKSIRFQNNNNKLISTKLFMVIISFLCYKYIYFFLKNSLKVNLQKLLKNPFFTINIYLILYWMSHFSASFLGQYIRYKLLLNYPVGNVLYKIITLLSKAKKKKIINGFKVLFSGRFTRKDRKLHKWKSLGWVGSSTMHGKLDYSLTLVILLNSLCGIKVWLNKKYNYDILSIL